jgi:hypothetical protein
MPLNFLCSLLILSFCCKPQQFDFDKLVGKWNQVSGNSMMPNKNKFVLEKTTEGYYKAKLTIVEPKKTIQYDLDINFDSNKNQWRLLATRDKKTTEWWSSGDDKVIYFITQLQENGTNYFNRQGFMITEKNELIRSVEKSFDGINFQGFEEKYVHEK